MVSALFRRLLVQQSCSAARWSKHLQNVYRDVLTVAGGDQEVTGDVQVSWRVRLVQSHHVLAAACPFQGDR